jgi:hypothetical protein
MNRNYLLFQFINTFIDDFKDIIILILYYNYLYVEVEF